MSSTIPRSCLFIFASFFLFFGLFSTFPQAIEDVPFDYNLIYESNEIEFNSDVTVADTNFDGEKEIYSLIHGGRENVKTTLLKLDNQGNEVFKVELNNFTQVYGKPVIGDFIEGDNLEIAILTRGFGDRLYVKFYESTQGVVLGDVEIPGNEGIVLDNYYENVLNVVKIAFGAEKLVLGYQPEVGNSQILLIGFDGIEAVELLINRDLTVNPFLIDFNDDGIQDVVYGWSYESQEEVDEDEHECGDSCLGLSVLNVAEGTMEELETIRTDLNANVLDVAVGDVDSDDYVDMVIISENVGKVGLSIFSNHDRGDLIHKRTGTFDEIEMNENLRLSLVDANSDGTSEIMVSGSSKLYDSRRDIIVESNFDFDIPFVNPAETLSVDFDDDGLHEYIGAFRTCGVAIYDDLAKFEILDFDSNDCVVRGMTLTSLEEGKTHLIAWYSPAPTEETFKIKIFEISPTLPNDIDNSWLMNNHDNCNSSNYELLNGCKAQFYSEPEPVGVSGNYLFTDVVSLQVRNFDLDNDGGLEFAAVTKAGDEYFLEVKDKTGDKIIDEDITDYIPELDTDLSTVREINLFTGNFDDDESLEFVVTNMVYYPTLVSIERPDEYTNFLIFDDNGDLLDLGNIATSQLNLDSEYAVADFNLDGIHEVIVAHSKLNESEGINFLQVSHIDQGIRKDSGTKRLEERENIAGVAVADLQGNGGLEFIVGYYGFNRTRNSMDYFIDGYIVEDSIFQPIFKRVFDKDIFNSLSFDIVSGDVDNQPGDEIVGVLTGVKNGKRSEYIEIHKWRQELSNVELFAESERELFPIDFRQTFIYGTTSLVDLNQDGKLEIINPREKLAYDYVNNVYMNLIEEDNFANQFRSSLNTAEFKNQDFPVSFVSSLSPLCKAYFVEDGGVLGQKEFDKNPACSIENIDLVQAEDGSLILGVQAAVPGKVGINYEIYQEDGLLFEDSDNIWLTRDHDNCGTHNYSSTQKCNNVELGTGITPSPTPSPTSTPTPTPTPSPTPPPVENPNHFINLCVVYSQDGTPVNPLDIYTGIPQLNGQFFTNATPWNNPFGEPSTSYEINLDNFELNTDVMFNDGVNDAYCEIYEFEGDNPTYYRYSEVESGLDVKYTDKNRPNFGYQFNEFDTYDNSLFDGDPTNDESRRKAQDGNMWFGKDGTTRNLIVNVEIDVPTYHELEVCSIVKDNEGQILETMVDSASEFGGSLFENVRVDYGEFGENEQEFEVGILNYELNADISNNDGVNDAFCQSRKYEDEGNEFYRYGFDTPVSAEITVNDIANKDNGYESVSFFDFDNSLYDGDPTNDDARNKAADGHVWLGNSNTKRRIVLDVVLPEMPDIPPIVNGDLLFFEVNDIDKDGELNYVGNFLHEGNAYFAIMDKDFNQLCVSDPILGVSHVSDLVVDNFDYDNRNEAAFMAGNAIYMFSDSCTLASGWPKFVYDHWDINHEIIKHDMNNDGIKDIITVSQTKQGGFDYAYILGFDSTNGDLIYNHGVQTTLARVHVGDFDGNGTNEFLIMKEIGDDSRSIVYEIRDFAYVQYRIKASLDEILYSSVVEDIDNDGKDELVTLESSFNGGVIDLKIHNFTSQYVNHFISETNRFDPIYGAYDYSRIDSMTIGQWDTDPEFELAIPLFIDHGVGYEVNYFFYDTTYAGNQEISLTHYLTVEPVNFESVAFDYDGDGLDEFIFLRNPINGECRISIFSEKGNVTEYVTSNTDIQCAAIDKEVYTNDNGNSEIAIKPLNGPVETIELN